MKRLLAALLLALSFAPALDAKPRKPSTSTAHRIHRSRSVREEFKRLTGYPHGRPGYVIDHIVPLACGGADAVYNLQWQSVAEAKAKDKWERKGCGK